MSSWIMTLAAVAFVLHRMGVLMPLLRIFVKAIVHTLSQNTPRLGEVKSKPPGLPRAKSTIPPDLAAKTLPQPKPIPKSVSPVQRMTGPLAERRLFRW